MKNKLVIAIDGPVGAGKGTLAVALAKRLGALYIYTGGMYRALTLACLRENVDLNDEEKVLEVLRKSAIDLKIAELGTRVFINNKEVTDEIFSLEVTSKVPVIAAFKKVRKEMVYRQRKMAQSNKVMIEGRDIATDVAPNADLKIYLTADVNVRAQRRLKQFQKRGLNISINEVIRDIETRDKQDMEREVSPLVIPSDAIAIDTTNDTVEDTLNKVLQILREKGLHD